MVETDAEVFRRSRKALPACRGGDLPSLGTDVALFSHANGPVTFLECVGGTAGELVAVFDELPPQGTPGREAEKPVNREGTGVGLVEGVAVEVVTCWVGAATTVAEELFAESSCAPTSFFSCTDAVDIRCAVRRGEFMMISG
jgi:hypothetical protein